MLAVYSEGRGGSRLEYTVTFIALTFSFIGHKKHWSSTLKNCEKKNNSFFYLYRELDRGRGGVLGGKLLRDTPYFSGNSFKQLKSAGVWVKNSAFSESLKRR